MDEAQEHGLARAPGAPAARRLNWRQACALLGCGRTHFYELVNSGRLPAFRLAGMGRGLWVYERDCVALVERLGEQR